MQLNLPYNIRVSNRLKYPKDLKDQDPKDVKDLNDSKGQKSSGFFSLIFSFI